MKTLKDVNLKGKKVVVRAEFNEPVENRALADDTRICATLPTLEYIFSQKPEIVVILSHIGRPEGQRSEDLSNKIIIPALEKLTKRKVVLVEYLKDLMSLISASGLNSDAIYLMENIRFWKEEKKGDPLFAKKIGELFDVYVNDCFSASHRDHASISSVPKHSKEKCAGLLFEQELRNLERVSKQPKHPAVMVIGGAKIKTKLPVIENLKDTYDKILVGGLIANEALDRKIELGKKIVLPIDFAPIEKEDQRLDIGPKTVEIFKKEIKDAKTIVWNGPMGKYEDAETAEGSKSVMKEIAQNSDAYQVVGGGETLEVIDEFGHFSDFDYVSMSGGAMLEFLAGKDLPGVVALED
ncbi:MAG: phosphoglycerate kinase [Patescibacteria group bacterium]|nr:phosphoglycerate kinase [Patescibacteria group bacterium]